MVSILQREEIDESSAHCLSFNFFGDRLAICFEDGNIQVWDMQNSKWVATYKFPSNHSGAIFKIRWAFPEFGSILATCSFDKSVNLYEENPLDKSWKKISQLVESHEPVEDIQFAPAHLRLHLAVCSSNGEIRIYEPASAANLKLWNSTTCFTASPFGSNVISWNPCSLHPTMMLIGNNDANKAKEKFNKTFEANVETLQLWGPGDDGKTWDKVFVPESCHERSVVDIAWAQLMGRSRHLVATADLDGVINIWRIDARGIMEIEETLREQARMGCSIGWDLMGTALSVAGMDSLLKIYKKTLQGRWAVMDEIKRTN